MDLSNMHANTTLAETHNTGEKGTIKGKLQASLSNFGSMTEFIYMPLDEQVTVIQKDTSTSTIAGDVVINENTVTMRVGVKDYKFFQEEGTERKSDRKASKKKEEFRAKSKELTIETERLMRLVDNLNKKHEHHKASLVAMKGKLMVMEKVILK